MTGICRLGDRCTGHGAFPPRANVTASSDVFVNGLGVHRQGDAWAVHCTPLPVCHAGIASAGSGTVFVNGQAVMRIGDPIDCGSFVAGGSGNVFAG